MSLGAQRKVSNPKGLYTTWVVLNPAEDLPDTWVAHALDFDVVTQGHTAEDAYRMAAEAVEMVLVDDLNEGRDPYVRRAPEECWASLERILVHGERLNRPKFLERLRASSEFSAFAVQMWFREGTPASARPEPESPVAFGSHESSSIAPASC